MNRKLFDSILKTFGTEPLAGSKETYAKVLLHPDDAIAVYFINAAPIKKDLEQRAYSWNPHLDAWEKRVNSIAEALAETEGYPTTAAALSQIQ